MKHIYTYQLFLEELNPNTPQGYLDSISQKKKLPVNKNQEKKPTDEVDDILQQTEEQKKKIIARKDAIEKGLLNNIRTLEPNNQKEVKTQVRDYRNQVGEFKKTVDQISKLNKSLKDSNLAAAQRSQMQKARGQIKL